MSGNERLITEGQGNYQPSNSLTSLFLLKEKLKKKKEKQQNKLFALADEPSCSYQEIKTFI